MYFRDQILYNESYSGSKEIYLGHFTLCRSLRPKYWSVSCSKRSDTFYKFIVKRSYEFGKNGKSRR